MGSIIILLMLLSFLHSLFATVFRRSRRFFLRQVYHAQLPRWLGGCFQLSRYNGLLIVVYFIGNICLLTVKVEDSSDFTRRLGRAALANLVPLCAGGRFNPVSHLLAIRCNNYLLIHHCVGIVFVIEASLHSILSWSHDKIDFGRWNDKAGLIVSYFQGL